MNSEQPLRHWLFVLYSHEHKNTQNQEKHKKRLYWCKCLLSTYHLLHMSLFLVILLSVLYPFYKIKKTDRLNMPTNMFLFRLLLLVWVFIVLVIIIVLIIVLVLAPIARRTLSGRWWWWWCWSLRLGCAPSLDLSIGNCLFNFTPDLCLCLDLVLIS